MYNKMSEKSGDCLGCRLISGFGIIAIGFYIYCQARHRKSLENYTMKAISVGAVSLGVARLMDLNLLKSKKSSQP